MTTSSYWTNENLHAVADVGHHPEKVVILEQNAPFDETQRRSGHDGTDEALLHGYQPQ
jgi:hypothetical protein